METVIHQCRRCGRTERVEQGGHTHFFGKCYDCREALYIRKALIEVFGLPTVPECNFEHKE